MHVLITGIGGFVGPRLARHLLETGHRVSGTWLESTPPPKLEEGVDLYHADLLDPASLEKAVRLSSPDAVVNLAGLSHVGESWKRPGEYFQVNVIGTENLLNAAAGRPVVVASSAEVYGPVPEEEQPISEDRPVDPRSPYALTKAAAERIALQRGAVVARSFNLVGPGQAASFAMPSFASQLVGIANGGEPVLRVGNLSARRDFVHVDDGAAAFRILAERGHPGHVYNIASGRAVSISEALERLMAVSGVRAEVREDPERMRPVDLPLLLGDNHHLRRLGWEPRRTLDDGLLDLWRDLQSQG
ncbi:MAG TPA: GDP-mannose 4,6-dehydratase [Thermoanaerobaculia bacterium]|nr:GDP-mannose 4,6-dehydratase [Thermoanaerobaculia bacterium]